MYRKILNIVPTFTGTMLFLSITLFVCLVFCKDRDSGLQGFSFSSFLYSALSIFHKMLQEKLAVKD